MFELFVVGSIGFWILVALEFLILIALTEYEQPGWSFVTLILVGVLLHFFGNINLLKIAVAHPGWTAIGIVGYLFVGTIWSVVKWFFYVHRKKEEYIEAKKEYEDSPEYDYPPGDRYKQGETTIKLPWEESRAKKRLANSKGGPQPLVRDNKSRVLMWMTYWPWSALWTIIDDPIKRAFRAIYNLIHTQMQKISDKAFEGIK